MWQACEADGPQGVDDFAFSASSGNSCPGRSSRATRTRWRRSGTPLATCDTLSSSLIRTLTPDALYRFAHMGANRAVSEKPCERQKERRHSH